MFPLGLVPDHLLSMEERVLVVHLLILNFLLSDLAIGPHLLVHRPRDMDETAHIVTKHQPRQVHLTQLGFIHHVLTKSMQQILKAVETIKHHHLYLLQTMLLLDHEVNHQLEPHLDHRLQPVVPLLVHK
jgi:hypothetical protein